MNTKKPITKKKEIILNNLPEHKNIFQSEESSQDDENKKEDMTMVGFETYGRKSKENIIFSHAFKSEKQNEDNSEKEKRLLEKMNKKYNQDEKKEVSFFIY